MLLQSVWVTGVGSHYADRLLVPSPAGLYCSWACLSCLWCSCAVGHFGTCCHRAEQPSWLLQAALVSVSGLRDMHHSVLEITILASGSILGIT